MILNISAAVSGHAKLNHITEANQDGDNDQKIYSFLCMLVEITKQVNVCTKICTVLIIKT